MRFIDKTDLSWESRAQGTETFGFLLTPGFSMMSLSSAVEPLRSLNRLSGEEAYRWVMMSVSGGAVRASNGIEIAGTNFATALPELDYVFVCGGSRLNKADEKACLAALRLAARQEKALGALSTATYFLARAGLLNGYRCTIHWENRSALQEDFPDIQCTNKLYEIDRKRVTCSGGSAAMDMMLHLIADRHGPAMARRVANQFHHERIRDASEDQRGGRLANIAFLPEKVRLAVKLMQRRIEEPLTLPEIAQTIHVTTRQMERLFVRHLGMPPLRYYVQIRIEHARELLLYSERPIIEIAVICGFTSTSHFSTWFRRIFGSRPSDMRDARLYHSGSGGALPRRIHAE